MKRVLSLLLTLMLSFSLAIPAFADIIVDEPVFMHSRPLSLVPVLLIVIITAVIIRKRKK